MAAPTAKRVPKVDFREAVSSFQMLDNRNLTHRHVIDGRKVLSFYVRRETVQVYDSTVSSVPKAREEEALKARESMSAVAAREAQMKVSGSSKSDRKKLEILKIFDFVRNIFMTLE